MAELARARLAMGLHNSGASSEGQDEEISRATFDAMCRVSAPTAGYASGDTRSAETVSKSTFFSSPLVFPLFASLVPNR